MPHGSNYKRAYGMNIYLYMHSTMVSYKSGIDKWKIKLATEASEYTRKLARDKGRQVASLKRKAEHMNNFQIKHPQHSQIVQIQKKLKNQLANAAINQAQANKASKTSYGVNIADSLHPAYLRRASTKRKKTIITNINRYPSYFQPDHNTQQSTNTEDLGEILKEVNFFFKELYKFQEPNPKAQEFAKELLSMKTLRNPDLCEGEIQAEHVAEMITKMKDGKVTGLDEIPAEYYKSHAESIKYHLAAYFNAIHKQGFLPYSLREGLIAIMYKNKGCRADLVNYRPITLLNSDLKLLTAILANRLAKVVCEISDIDNTAYAQGRYITDNIMLTQILQSFLDNEESPGYLIFYDVLKCFDMISWDSIHHTFEHLRFGPSMIRWVHTLYNKNHPAIRSVLVNGHQTPKFLIVKSVAQGDSISVFMQILVFETISRGLNLAPYKGITIPSLTDNDTKDLQGVDRNEIRKIQFADDTGAAVENENEISIPAPPYALLWHVG